jgi:tetratricopeptide (TPR) repeat protein
MKRSMIGTCACAFLLSACAMEAPVVRTGKVVQVPLEQHLAEAERDAAGGQQDKAIAGLRAAAASYPSEKAPWLQMAQLQFERGSYGDAIGNALEALQRDPADRQGNSIVAVSGLRLSTKALADLSLQNNLGGSLRTEAQELANLLRVSLGEEILVPQVGRGKAAPRKAVQGGGPPARKAAPGQGASDPFSALK